MMLLIYSVILNLNNANIALTHWEFLKNGLFQQHHKYSDAVSKAYYAMFYAASALLRTKNLDISKHSGVISQFGLHFVKTGIIEKDHHKRFIKAFNDRDVADYRIMKEIIEHVAAQKLEDAQKFIESIKTFLIKESWL